MGFSQEWGQIVIFVLGVACVLLGVIIFFLKKQQQTERRLFRQKLRFKLSEEKQVAELEKQKQKLLFEKQSKEQSLEQEVKQRENTLFAERLKQEKLRLEHTQRSIGHQEIVLEEKEQQLKVLLGEYKNKLIESTKLSEEAVVEELRKTIKRECESDLKEYRHQLLEKSEQSIRSEAQKILVDAIQRLLSTPIIDATATTVKIPSEEMKGRLIGREGRNIKAFEIQTGTTLMIDETPGSVLVSSFDPIRREIARIALEKLIQDGRIHPASIEDAVENAKGEMHNIISERGAEALSSLDISDTHAELPEYLGKLYYRYSYQQNTLEHSIEVAYCCSLLAAEIGLDSEIAKRCGLFHDIGKAVDETHEGSHALAGAQLLKRLGESETVVNAVAAHHEEEKGISLYASLVVIADSISASRPGARSETLDDYFQRIKSLEGLVKRFEGIREAYAIQGGKEVRILVEPQSVNDEKAYSLTRKIREAIESQLDYPSSIKITLIREQRFSEVAK